MERRDKLLQGFGQKLPATGETWEMLTSLTMLIHLSVKQLDYPDVVDRLNNSFFVLYFFFAYVSLKLYVIMFQIF